MQSVIACGIINEKQGINMTAYLNDFYQRLTTAPRADLIGLYQKFAMPDRIRQEIHARITNAFNKLWENPDFRLYMFYRIKNGKNIPGSLDWLTTMVGHVMGVAGLKQPNTYESDDNSVAFYRSTYNAAQTLNFSTVSLESEPSELLDTIFHEFTHELQEKGGGSADDAWNKIIQFNKINYVSHKMDAVAYRNQPVEAEAYLAGEVIQELVQEKCNALAKAKFIDYPEDNDKDYIYGFTINPYQYLDAASKLLKTEKMRKMDCVFQFESVLNRLDKAIDYGRFVNGGTCARDAIGFLVSIADSSKYKNLHKHIPNIQDRIITVLNKYKDDPAVAQAIKNAKMRLGRQNVRIMYSASENTPGRVAIYVPNTPEK